MKDLLRTLEANSLFIINEIIEDLKTQAYSFGARYIDQDVINIDFSEWPYKTTLKNGWF